MAHIILLIAPLPMTFIRTVECGYGKGLSLRIASSPVTRGVRAKAQALRLCRHCGQPHCLQLLCLCAPPFGFLVDDRNSGFVRLLEAAPPLIHRAKFLFWECSVRCHTTEIARQVSWTSPSRRCKFMGPVSIFQEKAARSRSSPAAGPTQCERQWGRNPGRGSP